MDCLVQHLTVQINEGNTSIKCPVDCNESMKQDEIQKYVPNELFGRFERQGFLFLLFKFFQILSFNIKKNYSLKRLQLDRAIGAIPNIVYCPQCNTPTENADPNTTNVLCGQCYHWFCINCREHGHRNDCETAQQQAVNNRRSMHLPGIISPEAREREEKLRRKKEEQKTLSELKRSDKTKQCPGCKIWIEKTYGCHHMTCKNCNVCED